MAFLFLERKERELIIPKSDLNIARSEMPQIKQVDVPEFIRELKAKGIHVTKERVMVSNIKPSQGDYNVDKLRKMIYEKFKADQAILMSNDHYIMDGHHRYAAELNRNPRFRMEVWKVDLKILDLLREAKNFHKTFARSTSE